MKIVLISTFEIGRQPFGLASPAAWLRAEYEDEAGKVWKELDVAELVRDANFLTVGS